MRILISVCVLSLTLFASDYYAKAEPKELYSIKSAVSGEVVHVDEVLEGKLAQNSIVIQIDDVINKADLKASKEKLSYLKNSISLSQKSLHNARQAANIDSENYARVKNLSSYSKVQKDAKLLSLINSQNSVISIESNLQTLKTQYADLELKIATLEDTIAKKSIAIEDGFYIYKIYPRKGDYVNPGSQLIDVYDISAAKLIVYVSSEEAIDIDTKTIYLDDKPTDYKVDKIWKVADSINISSYRVEILIDKPAQFSKLIKVAFK